MIITRISVIIFFFYFFILDYLKTDLKHHHGFVILDNHISQNVAIGRNMISPFFSNIYFSKSQSIKSTLPTG